MPDEQGKMTEEEAIAEVARLGRDLKNTDSAQTAWYALRIGVALAGLGIMSLLMLFAYTVMSKSGGVPVARLIMSSILIAAGVATAFWGQQNDPKRPD